jgi:uncharacterized membrane-anchored protein
MTTGRAGWDGPARPAEYAASKVPLITAYFWIIKLLTTAMGEATSDYMVRTISPVTAVLLGFVGFVIAIVLQFRTKRYVAWVYWLAVVMVAVFGTMAADVLHIKFHVPYVASSTFYAIVLTVIFILWYRSEGTLSIHSIRTPRREAFYWATVLATFALGTAVGDMTARTLHLGYLASGILFTVLIMVPLVAHWKFGMNPILAFWIAYVLTRPVGASYADYVAFPKSVGGLDAGHGPVALFLTVIIIGFVAYLSVTRLDVEELADDSRSGTSASARHRRDTAPSAGYYWSTPQPPGPGDYRSSPSMGPGDYRPSPSMGPGDYRPPPQPTEPGSRSAYRPPAQPMEPRGLSDVRPPRGLSDIQYPRRGVEPRLGPYEYGPSRRPVEPRGSGEHRPTYGSVELRPGPGEYRPTHGSAEPRPGPGEYRPTHGSAEPRPGPGEYRPTHGSAEPRPGPGEYRPPPGPAEPRSRREAADEDWDPAAPHPRDDYSPWDEQ